MIWEQESNSKLRTHVGRPFTRDTLRHQTSEKENRRRQFPDEVGGFADELGDRCKRLTFFNPKGCLLRTV